MPRAGDPSSTESMRRRTFQGGQVPSSAMPRQPGAGELLLEQLQQLIAQIQTQGGNALGVAQQQFPAFQEQIMPGVGAAQQQGLNLDDILGVAPQVDYAMEQIWPLIEQTRARARQEAAMPTAGPGVAGPPVSQSTPDPATAQVQELLNQLGTRASEFGQDALNVGRSALDQLPDLPPETADLLMRALGLGQGIPQTGREWFERGWMPWERGLADAGHSIMRGLGFEDTEAGAEPGFDLVGALSRFGQLGVEGAQGPGGPGGQGFGPGFYASLGPALQLPPAVSEPLPPELDLSSVRSAFAGAEPQPTTPEELQMLKAAQILQGLGQGGLAGTGGTLAEMILATGFGGLSGWGAGIGQQAQRKDLDRNEREAYLRALAQFELDATQAQRAAKEDERLAIVRNLERADARSIAQQQVNAPRSLGMSAAGPVFEVTRDGQRRLQLFPIEEPQRGSEADELFGGQYGPVAKIADELVQSGQFGAVFPPDTMEEITQRAEEMMQAGGVSSVDVNPKEYLPLLQKALRSAITERLVQNPDLIPMAAQHSNFALGLSQLEGLGPQGTK